MGDRDAVNPGVPVESMESEAPVPLGVPPPLKSAELREARAETLPELVTVPARPVRVGARGVGVASAEPAAKDEGVEVCNAGEGVDEVLTPKFGLEVDAGETVDDFEWMAVPLEVPLPENTPEAVMEMMPLAVRVPPASLLRGVPVAPSTSVAETVAVGRSGEGVEEEVTPEGVEV